MVSWFTQKRIRCSARGGFRALRSRVTRASRHRVPPPIFVAFARRSSLAAYGIRFRGDLENSSLYVSDTLIRGATFSGIDVTELAGTDTRATIEVPDVDDSVGRRHRPPRGLDARRQRRAGAQWRKSRRSGRSREQWPFSLAGLQVRACGLTSGCDRSSDAPAYFAGNVPEKVPLVVLPSTVLFPRLRI